MLTHHPREPIEMAGGTTFHLVAEGFDADTRVGVDQVEVQHSAWATHLRYCIVP